MSDRNLRLALLLVSSIGIGVSVYLTYVHYQPAALICTAGGGCETVQDSKYAVLAGIPLAVLGLSAWITALALTIWNSDLARTLTAALALVAVAFVGYLVILQLFVIDAICVWCASYGISLVLRFLVALWVWLRRDRMATQAAGW